MPKVLIVFVGSGLGGLARYQWGLGVARLLGNNFPYGTISINIVGSFFFALIMDLSLRTTWIAPELRLFLTTGIISGYTTYSTFNYETLALVQHGAWGPAAANLTVTGVLCFVAGVLGIALGSVVAGR